MTKITKPAAKTATKAKPAAVEITNPHESIETALAAYQAEHAKFEGGNNAAGTRARKALGDLAKAVKARRNQITETKNARKEAKA